MSREHKRKSTSDSSSQRHDKGQHRKKVTITTGPLVIPAQITANSVTPDYLITIYIILKNPTSRFLSTSITIGEVDIPPDTTQTTRASVPTVIESPSITEKENHLGTFTIAPRSVKLISFLPVFPPPNSIVVTSTPPALSINNPATRIVRVSAKGDFLAHAGRAVCGLLEIQVQGGVSQLTSQELSGITTVPSPNNPIINGAELVQAKFADFVVCYKDRDT